MSIKDKGRSMDLYQKKSSAKAGMMPGSAVYIGELPPRPTQLLIHIYDSEGYQKLETFQPELIHLALAKEQHVWIDICGLADIQQIVHICSEFAIHPLITEDILNTHQRPKLDNIEDSLFFVCKLLDMPGNSLDYTSEQFSMVLKKNLLLSFRESNKYSFDPLYRRLSCGKEPRIRIQDSSFLSYLIMDYLIDGYFSFVEKSDQHLEYMENLLIKDPLLIHLKDLYTLKRRTSTLRKIIGPLRDLIHVLVMEHVYLIDRRNLLYYRDLLDHSTRLLESIDLQRETITGFLEMYMSNLNTRMNETIKVLTIFASLFIPLTFVAGIYGMNFEHMPELKWRYSYPLVLLIMLIIAMLMLYYFKRKRLI
jgi:magnesium transporter